MKWIQRDRWLGNYWQAVLLALGTMLFVAGLLGLGLNGFQLAEVGRAQTRLSQANQGAIQAFQASLDDLLALIDGTHIQLLELDNPEPPSGASFEALAATLSAHFPEVDWIVLAANDVIEQVYPADDSLVGTDLLPQLPAVASIRRALPDEPVATRIEPVGSYPESTAIDVIQVLQQEGLDASTLVVRFDLAALIRRVLEPALSPEVDYAVLTSNGGWLAGAQELRVQDAIQVHLNLDYDVWSVFLVPRQGWESLLGPGYETALLFGIVVVFIAAAGALWGGIQNLSLRRRALELARANRALQDSEERARSLVEASSDAVIGLDGQRRIVLANAAAQAMFGIAEAALLDMRLEDLIPDPEGMQATPPDDSPESEASQTAAATVELSGRRSDGKAFPIEVSISFVPWDEGSLMQVLNIRDVSSRVAQAEALWRSEARYRSLAEDVLDSATVGMIILDATFHVVWVNQALERYFGLSRTEILGQRQGDLIRMRIAPAFERPEEFAARVLATYDVNTSVEHFECRVVAGPGREARWLEHWSQPITKGLYAGGRVEYYYDISMRMAAEERLRADQSDLQAKTHSLQVLNAVADTLHRSLDFRTVARQALDFVQSYMHAPGVVLHSLDEGGETLDLVISSGFSPEMEEAIGHLPVNASLTGLAVRRKEVLISHDMLTDERVAFQIRAQLEREGYTVAIFVPLVYQDQVQGTLGLMFHGDSQLTAQEMNTLWAIGAAIGLAFSNARYVTQVEREIRERMRAEQAEREERVFAEALRDSAAAINSTLDLDEVLDRLLAHLAEALPPSQASVILLREEDVARIVRSRVDEGHPSAGFERTTLPIASTSNLQRMLELGQPLAVPDTAAYPAWQRFAAAVWAHSYLGAPILDVEGQVMGFISLYSAEVGRYTEQHAGRLQAFANQAGVAISNARLYGEVRRQREIDSALYDLSMMLNSSLSLDATLDRLLQGALTVIDSDAANVMLIEDDRIRVARGLGYDSPGRFNPLGVARPVADTPNLVWMVQHRTVLNIPNVSEYPGWLNIPGTEWLRSWAGVPIIRRSGALAGILALDSGRIGAFNDQDMRILESFANSAAIAIENASLFEAEQRQRETAEVMRDIALTISSSLNQSEVLDAILDQIARVIPYDGAAFWLESGQGRQTIAALMGYEQAHQSDVLFNTRFEARTLWAAGSAATQPEIFSARDDRDGGRADRPPGFEWAQTWAAVPLRIQERLVGTLLLGNAGPDGFVAAQLPLLQTLGQQISLAIQNLRLFEKTQQYLNQMIMLRHIGLEMSVSQQDLMAMLDLVLDNFVRLMPAESNAVWLWNEASQQLFPVVYHQTYTFQGEEGPRLRWGQGVPGRALAQRETILDNDGSQWASSGLGSSVPLSAMLAVPLALRDEPLGVLTASLVGPGSNFDEDDVRLVQLFAGQVAPLMVNARLYQEIEQYASSLQDLVAIRTRELEVERSQLNTILDGMTEGVVYSEGDRILYVNRAMCDLTGYLPGELKDLSSVFALIFSEREPGWRQEYVDRVSRALALGGVWRDEVSLRRKDGVLFDVSVTAAVIRSEDSALETVTILRDISQEKALRNEKDRFIAHASHELRTPIANMKTRLYLARKQPDRISQHLDVMEYVTERMRGLVEDLLELSRFERGVIPLKRRDTILQTLLEQVVTVQRPEAQAHDIALTLELPESPILVHIDPARIEQVVTNLVVNAISYTLPGGRVTVRVRLDDTGPERANRVCVEVQDTGIGIGPELVDRVFEPFFRVNETVAVGTGLGLPIAREIVREHGGDLVVESRPDVGSTFCFDLRLAGTHE